jgi:putative oxidoreductase
MKLATNIVGGLLGLAFIAFSLLFFFGPTPPAPPADSLPGKFMAGFGPTGYLTFVKLCELIGGILVAVPKTRNLGLLVLGPIIINILCFHGFVMKGEGLFSPVIIIIVVAALFLLWSERLAFGGLVKR